MEWSEDKYPTYSSEAGYLLSMRAAKKLLQAFELTLRQMYVWMEDIYLTGVLRIYSQINLVAVPV